MRSGVIISVLSHPLSALIPPPLFQESSPPPHHLDFCLSSLNPKPYSGLRCRQVPQGRVRCCGGGGRSSGS